MSYYTIVISKLQVTGSFISKAFFNSEMLENGKFRAWRVLFYKNQLLH
jgi:hypothetical protein